MGDTTQYGDIKIQGLTLETLARHVADSAFALFHTQVFSTPGAAT